MNKVTRVLLVEPDEVLAQGYMRALTGAGYRVECVSSAQETLEILQEFMPNAIVLELLLQNHNGIELLYELQSYQDTRGIPVIINSFINRREIGLTPKQAEQLSIVDYLYKPKTTPQQLVGTLKVLRGAHA